MKKLPSTSLSFSEMLGVTMDFDVGRFLVGRLSETDRAFLHECSSAHPFHRDRSEKVGMEDQFNPTPARERNEFFFDFAEVDARDTFDLIPPSLSALLPRLCSIPNLRFTFLKCDYLALHDDLTMKGHDHVHSLAILLDAPHGCQLVTNGSYVNSMLPGDAVLIDDQTKHGAYPRGKPESTAEAHLASLPIAEQEAFVERNCLSFLLICAQVD